MGTIKKDILTDVHPSSLLHKKNTVVEEFDNKEDFLYHVQKKQGKYDLTKFLSNVKNYDVDQKRVETIRNNVRNNLIKRGIITGTIYEGYKYDIEGEIIDYAELATGNPKCYRTPIKKYDKWFYELYVNMSIPWSVSGDRIVDGAIRLAETIKALEELNIEIKVNVILFSDGMFKDRRNYLFILPLASHLEYKDHNILLPYMDGAFLRNALFTTMFAHDDVDESLGTATKLKNSVNLWELQSDSEVELANRVLMDLDLKC